MNKLDAMTTAKIAEASELVIRAASVLGTLSPDQQKAMHRATKGFLPHSLGMFLRCARVLSDAVEDSLTTHPPRGLRDFWY